MKSALGEGTLVWVDREGQVSPFVEETAAYRYPRLSPDGRQLAVGVQGTDPSETVWVYGTEGGARLQLTSGQRSSHPVWTPDGARLTFTMGDQQNIAWRTADGTGEPEELLARESGQYPWSWSPNGQQLAFYERKATGDRDIWVLPLEGGRTPTPFITSPPDERAPRFSPDGHWLAYVSDESRQDDVYVRGYPGPGAQLKVSSDGGTEPVWSSDGRELFYRNGSQMMAVTVQTSPTFSAGPPRFLFNGPFYLSEIGNANFDVAADGQSFVMIRTAERTAETNLNIVLNWFQELKERVPVD